MTCSQASAAQPGGGGLTPRARVDNHFAAFAPWDNECIAGMRKESEVHVFYDIHRLATENIGLMVSVNGATLCRDRVTPDAIVMVTANARGHYKIVWHTFLEGREALPDPAYCYANQIDITNPGPQLTKADGSRLAKLVSGPPTQPAGAVQIAMFVCP